MKKFKIALWVIFVALLVTVFFQNKDFLIGKQSIKLNLYIADQMESPQWPIAVWFLAAMVIGFLISYFSALIEKFKTNRLLKGLKAKMEAQDQLIAQLKQKLGISPGGASSDAVDANPIDVSATELETQILPKDNR